MKAVVAIVLALPVASQREHIKGGGPGHDGATSSSSNFLFDLKSDPYESSDIYDKSSSSSIIKKISAYHDTYAKLVVTPTELSKTVVDSGFEKCGGVCSFMDKEVQGSKSKNGKSTKKAAPLLPPQKAEVPPKMAKQEKAPRQLRNIDAAHAFEGEEGRPKSSSSSSPNIVFVLVDDWGYNDVGYRSTYMDWTTPNIDKLASQGVKLENYYTAYYCMPARSSLMTGRYAIRQGMWSSSYESELPLDESTLAEELQDAGYKTYMVGKWHLGYSSSAHKPLSRGFDEYYGFLTGKVDYWTKKYNNKYLDLQDGNSLVTSSSETSSDYHNAYLMQDKAEAMIASHYKSYGAKKPFFLYYSMQMIHSPLSAPDVYINRCHKPTSISDDTVYDTERNYCAMNVMLDEAVANLTCSLNNYGYSDNTYLILASDNGGDPSGYGSSYPFKGYKDLAWNGGVAATAIIHSKLLSSSVKGSKYTGLMHVTDWMPTLMHIATNGKWSKPSSKYDIDGVDMYKAITKGKSSDRDVIVHYHDGTSSVIQYGDYKLFTNYADSTVTKPKYTFDSDQDSSASSISCSSPTFYSAYRSYGMRTLAEAAEYVARVVKAYWV